jgi:hypothetical protein
VPAGKYRALRIDHDGTWSSSCGSGRIAKKFWYVPELKYYAKFESLDYGPDGQVADASVTELQSTRVD